jgi:transcriptional regulator with XRE-family HTH domain
MTEASAIRREWIRQVLESRGYIQRDLAKLWGCSEAAASRFLNGLDSGDLPMSRAYPLSRMLGMPIDELAARMGWAGDTVNLPPPQTTAAPPLGTFQVTPHDGRVRALVHFDLSPEAAGGLVQLLASASAGQGDPKTEPPPPARKLGSVA